MSIYSGIWQECFRTDLRGAGEATEQSKFLSRNGRESIKRSTGTETAASGSSSRLGERQKVLLCSEVILWLIVVVTVPRERRWTSAGATSRHRGSTMLCFSRSREPDIVRCWVWAIQMRSGRCTWAK
jgi:hypothetical protein